MPTTTSSSIRHPPCLAVRCSRGDTGELKGETRRCLVALLSGPSVDGRRQPSLWQVLIRDWRVLQSRLHESFLDLVVDIKQQVAFIRQITSEDGDSIPILLRRQQLTFIESAFSSVCQNGIISGAISWLPCGRYSCSQTLSGKGDIKKLTAH